MATKNKIVSIPKLLVAAGLAKSISEAKRLIKAGAVSIDRLDGKGLEKVDYMAAELETEFIN